MTLFGYLAIAFSLVYSLAALRVPGRASERVRTGGGTQIAGKKTSNNGMI